MVSRIVTAQLKRIELSKKPLLNKIAKLQAKKDALDEEIKSIQAVLDTFIASERVLKGESSGQDPESVMPEVSPLEGYEEEIPVSAVEEMTHDEWK